MKRLLVSALALISVAAPATGLAAQSAAAGPHHAPAIIGTNHSDVPLVGTFRGETIRGLAGKDVIRPKAGDDFVVPGLDCGLVSCSMGDDTMNLRDNGPDTAFGGRGFNVAYVDAYTPGYWTQFGQWIPAQPVDDVTGFDLVYAPGGELILPAL